MFLGLRPTGAAADEPIKPLAGNWKDAGHLAYFNTWDVWYADRTETERHLTDTDRKRLQGAILLKGTAA